MKLIAYIALALFLIYFTAACAAWEWRNPKANSTTRLSHIVDVLQFKKLDKFQ